MRTCCRLLNDFFFLKTINAYISNITSYMTSVRSHFVRDTLMVALNNLK